MLINCIRSVFNILKNTEPKTHYILITTRMIYEFERDKNLFELGDLLLSNKSFKNSSNSVINSHDLNKKLNEWSSDKKWV